MIKLLDFINGSNRPGPDGSHASVSLNGRDLTLDDVVHVSRFGARVELTDTQRILNRVATDIGASGRLPTAINEMLTNGRALR